MRLLYFSHFILEFTAVYITHAKKRVYRGRVIRYKRSSFLDRIEKRFLELEKRESSKNKKDDNQLNLF